MNAQAFTISTSPTILCPGAYLSAAGRAVLATGIIKRILIERNEDGVDSGQVEVFDAYDTNGDTFRSTGRFKREIDLTAATAMRQSLFELRGTGITGGPALSTYNRKALFSVPPKTDGVGGHGGGQVVFDCDILCWHGMILQVSSMNASDIVTVVYEPRTLGKGYYNRATHQLAY